MRPWESPDKLMRLIDEATRDREIKRKMVRSIEDQALGEYGDTMKPKQPENLAFATAALLLPFMMRSPRGWVTSSGGMQGRMVAIGAQGAVNQLSRQTNLPDEFEPCAWDYANGWTAMFVEAAETDRVDLTDEERMAIGGVWRDGMATPQGPQQSARRVRPEWARAKYLHPDQFFHDTKVRTKSEWRFMGHSQIENREDLCERAKAAPDDWIVEEVERLLPSNSADTMGYAKLRGERVVDRDEVLYYVIYIPDGRIEGKDRKPWDRGVIRTIAPVVSRGMGGAVQAMGGVEIRRPYYYRGHPAGPYVHAGQYTHTRDTFPLTAILANSDTVDMVNAATSAVYQKIRERKDWFIYDGRFQQQVEEVLRAPNGSWVGLPGFAPGMVERLESGGPTQGDMRDLAILQNRAAVALALDDARRGSAPDDATATAIRQASAMAASRSGNLLRNWKRFVGEVLERLLAHVVMSERFFVRLDEPSRDDHRRAVLEAAAPYLERSMGLRLTSSDRETLVRGARPEALPLQGGDFADNEHAWWDLRLEVRVTSGSEEGGIEASLREQQIDQLLSFYAQQMVQAPHVNWKQRAAEHFAAIGADGMERLLDEERASLIVGMQILGAGPEVETGTQMGVEPRIPDIFPSAGAGGGGRRQEPMQIGAGE